MSFNRKQYEDGFKVEREHITTYRWLSQYIQTYKSMPKPETFFLHIVEDHLKEDPNYYDKLNKAGL